MSEQNERVGTCKYCGQISVVKSDKVLTEVELNNEATWNCNCPEAVAVRERELNLRTAKNAVEALFKDMEKEADFLKMACELLADGTLKSVNIDTGGTVKATLRVTTKGKIRVTRKMSDKQELES